VYLPFRHIYKNWVKFLKCILSGGGSFTIGNKYSNNYQQNNRVQNGSINLSDRNPAGVNFESFDQIFGQFPNFFRQQNKPSSRPRSNINQKPGQQYSGKDIHLISCPRVLTSH
jgi:hypothetical protein